MCIPDALPDEKIRPAGISMGGSVQVFVDADQARPRPGPTADQIPVLFGEGNVVSLAAVCVRYGRTMGWTKNEGVFSTHM